MADRGSSKTRQRDTRSAVSPFAHVAHAMPTPLARIAHPGPPGGGAPALRQVEQVDEARAPRECTLRPVSCLRVDAPRSTPAIGKNASDGGTGGERGIECRFDQ